MNKTKTIGEKKQYHIIQLTLKKEIYDFVFNSANYLNISIDDFITLCCLFHLDNKKGLEYLNKLEYNNKETIQNFFK